MNNLSHTLKSLSLSIRSIFWGPEERALLALVRVCNAYGHHCYACPFITRHGDEYICPIEEYKKVIDRLVEQAKRRRGAV